MWATLCCAVLWIRSPGGCDGSVEKVGWLVRGGGGGRREERMELYRMKECNITDATQWLVLCSIGTLLQSSLRHQREVLSTTAGGNCWCSASQNSGRSRITPVENTMLRRTVKLLLMLFPGEKTPFVFLVCVHHDIDPATLWRHITGNSL